MGGRNLECATALQKETAAGNLANDSVGSTCGTTRHTAIDVDHPVVGNRQCAAASHEHRTAKARTAAAAVRCAVTTTETTGTATTDTLNTCTHATAKSACPAPASGDAIAASTAAAHIVGSTATTTASAHQSSRRAVATTAAASAGYPDEQIAAVGAIIASAVVSTLNVIAPDGANRVSRIKAVSARRRSIAKRNNP